MPWMDSCIGGIYGAGGHSCKKNSVNKYCLYRLDSSLRPLVNREDAMDKNTGDRQLRCLPSWRIYAVMKGNVVVTIIPAPVYYVATPSVLVVVSIFLGKWRLGEVGESRARIRNIVDVVHPGRKNRSTAVGCGTLATPRIHAQMQSIVMMREKKTHILLLYSCRIHHWHKTKQYKTW